MKRFASLFLSAVMLMTMGVPAAASDSGKNTDQRLAEVTAKVKKTLNIGDEYTTFSGELWENELAPVWELSWSREEDSISVTASEDGKVLDYYLNENGAAAILAGRDRGFPPSFPAVAGEEARKIAEDFLKTVLETPLETASFSENNSGRLNTETTRFNGTVLLNGLPSPFSFSLTVRGSDGKVIRFHRDNPESSVIGKTPSAKPASGKTDAGKLLKDTLALRLEYVLDPDSVAAFLRYLPESADEYFVDAQTGELVNLTKLYQEASKGEGAAAEFTSAGSGNAAPEAAAQDTGGLTQAELDGISKLEGVQAKEALDKKLREISALGLEKYTLASVSYSLDQETGSVSARLSYTRKDASGIWRRHVVCDARTAGLLSVYSSAPYDKEREPSVSESEARKIGEAFLAELWGTEFSAVELYNSSPWSSGQDLSHSFTYAQKENGYFFPENSLRVSVDAADGSISGLDRVWTEDVTFDSPDGILDGDAALNAWFHHYDITLAYGSVPVKLDLSRDPGRPVSSLLEMGYTYFYTLKLAYFLTEPEGARCSGVDAKTGEPVQRDMGTSGTEISYSDLEGHWAKAQVEALAEYGIGWYGGACRPRDTLTQLDMVALLSSADGYCFDPESGNVDELYRRAYNLGILHPSQRKEDSVLTRGETVKMLLDCAGYGAAAKLQGIFTCSFTDREDIPDGLLGYAALAQGLGAVTGGSFDAGRTVTRAEAAVMLYNLMRR